GAVPALHREHAEPVAHTDAAEVERLRQRGRRTVLDVDVEGKVDAELAKMRAKRVGRFQAGDAPVRRGGAHDGSITNTFSCIVLVRQELDARSSVARCMTRSAVASARSSSPFVRPSRITTM